MNYQVLVSEIAEEKYKGMNDQEVADALNAVEIATIRNVQIRELAQWSSQNGIMPALFAAERDPATPASLYGAIRTLLTILTPGLLDSWEILDVSGEPTGAASEIMGGLVQAGLMTSGQAGELVTMAKTMTSRAAQIGLPFVGAHHVAAARGG